ncbi:hypothetical protein ACWGJT_27515 [Streptomyces xantholiticus]
MVDLGSHNGTYLNGLPVGRAPVLPGDIAGIGHSAFVLVGDELREFADTGEDLPPDPPRWAVPVLPGPPSGRRHRERGTGWPRRRARAPRRPGGNRRPADPPHRPPTARVPRRRP